MKTTRRQFLANSGKVISGLGATSLVPGSAFSILKEKAPNEKNNRDSSAAMEWAG